MPSLKTARTISSIITNNATSIGQIHKNNSDFAMEYTWDNDIQSKCCYIYDFFHDDQPELNKNMTYDNTTKTKIDAKFIIKSYGSMDKDQVEYHIQFKPSQKLEFSEDDELYYFETDYRKKFDMIYPTGLFIDIPDEKGNYVKWLICDFEEGNQFTKYQVLPCDYRFQWISIENGKKVKRQMWGCTRSANSYTSGLWLDRYLTGLDDINKILLPLNNITKSFGHVKENGENQRVILSAKMDYPLTWKVSKIENTKPIGIIKVTLKEDFFNQNTDFVEKDKDDNIIGMWADYYDTSIEPITPEELVPEPKPYNNCIGSASIYSIKNGGSARTITFSYFNEENEDISYQYSETDKEFQFIVDNDDVSEYVTYTVQKDKNVIKVKFSNSDYIGKILTIKCLVEYIWGEVKLQIV